MSDAANARKILLIGVDGGCWSVLHRAMDAGVMPALKEMKDRGGSGALLSTIPPKTPAAWAAFQTGKNPGANGVFDFAWWDRQSRKNIYVSSASLHETLWDLAGRAGKRICAINVPMTYPPKAVEGNLVTGILTPSLESEFTYPASLKKELLQAVPGYHIFNLKNLQTETVHKNPAGFLDRMTEIMENRSRAAVFLMQREPFDLFMVHFQVNDVVQHALWGFMNPDHPDYDASICRMVFERFYKKLDEKIRQLCEVFGRGAEGPVTTVVLSDHGFQTHLKRVNLGWWLVQQGFLKTRKIPLRRRLERLRRRLQGKKEILKADFLWDESSVYSFSRGNDGFLYFLEEDPEKRKIIQARLRPLLDALSDPDTGRPLVKEIHTREAIYRGEYVDRMPDWVIVPTDGYSFTGNYLPKQKKLFQPVRRQTDFHVGMHHAEGILLVSGPAVKPGMQVSGARLIDLAPTLLALLGVPIPKEVEGRVLSELFEETLQAQVAQTSQDQTAPESSTVYSQEDVDKIQQRLRDLGYIE